MPQYYLKTFGCQMNEHDSGAIGALLAARGFTPATAMDQADLILFNTCTIREKAEQKALSDLGRTAELKAQRPGTIVGMCGCVAQREQNGLFARFPQLDLLFGPDQVHLLPRLLDEVMTERRQVAALELVDRPEAYRFLDLIPHLGADTTSGVEAAVAEWELKTFGPSAFVTIMKGCDSNCAFCIVPTVRGTEVCRPADQIIAEVTALAARGVKEVTLLGQTVNTYGNRRHTGVMPFPELLRAIAANTPIARLRFTSPHPKDLNDALIAVYADTPQLCRHIHLPVQSGSDRVLRTMRRSYSRAQYLEKVAALRAAVPDIAITTDMIVGFCGETEADFGETLSLVEAVGFDNVFAFKYSPRPGTDSFARLADDVLPEAKDDRLQRLFTVGNTVTSRRLAGYVGRTLDVLVEGPSKRGTLWTGRTTYNTPVHFDRAGLQPGQLVPIEITLASGHSLEGRCNG